MVRALKWSLTAIALLGVLDIVLALSVGEGRVLITAIPAWSLIGLGAAGLWFDDIRRRRRARLAAAGRCPSCGYDRRGLAGDAKCPECGAVADPTKK